MSDKRIDELIFKGGSSYETRKKIFFHYICERENNNRLEQNKKRSIVDFNDIFERVLDYHHEYLPEQKIGRLDFHDIFKELEKEGNILYYRSNKIANDLRIIGTLWEIIFLDSFFKIPEIKKFIKKYKLTKIKEKITNNSPKTEIKFGDDIIFDLSQKTFKIGKTLIKDISFSHLEQASLRDKTPKIIRWLFAIINELNEGNNIIKEDPKFYASSLKQFDKIFPPKRKSMELGLGCNISNLKALLKLSDQNIEIKKGDKKGTWIVLP